MKFSASKLKKLVEADKRISKEIAEAGGFSVASISHWALGRRVPGADELASLSRVFGVPLDYFFEGPDAPGDAKTPAPNTIVKLRLQLASLKRQVEQIETTINETDKKP